MVLINNLTGLTKLMKAGSHEFVIHVKKEHDLRINSEHRDNIFQVLKKEFLTQSEDNLPIFGISK